MKKLMMLAALLAMLVVAALPALAQVDQEVEQEIDESGDIEQAFEITGGGANGSQCANVQGATNTGSAQGNTAILQYASETEEFEFEDQENSVSVIPESSVECTQEVNQAAAAG